MQLDKMTKAQLIDLVNELNNSLKLSVKHQKDALYMMSKKFVSADISENREALMMLGGLLAMLDPEQEDETQI